MNRIKIRKKTNRNFDAAVEEEVARRLSLVVEAAVSDYARLNQDQKAYIKELELRLERIKDTLPKRKKSRPPVRFPEEYDEYVAVDRIAQDGSTVREMIRRGEVDGR